LTAQTLRVRLLPLIRTLRQTFLTALRRFFFVTLILDRDRRPASRARAARRPDRRMYGWRG
jgi:hypothetical protein